MQEANRIFILPEGFVEPQLGQDTAESETRLPHSLQVIKAILEDLYFIFNCSSIKGVCIKKNASNIKNEASNLAGSFSYLNFFATRRAL